MARKIYILPHVTLWLSEIWTVIWNLWKNPWTSFQCRRINQGLHAGWWWYGLSITWSRSWQFAHCHQKKWLSEWCISQCQTWISSLQLPLEDTKLEQLHTSEPINIYSVMEIMERWWNNQMNPVPQSPKDQQATFKRLVFRHCFVIKIGILTKPCHCFVIKIGILTKPCTRNNYSTKLKSHLWNEWAH